MNLDKTALRELYDRMLVNRQNALAPGPTTPRIEWVAMAAQGQGVNRVPRVATFGGLLGLPDDRSPLSHGGVLLSEAERLLSALYFGCSVVAQYVSGAGIYIAALDGEAAAANAIATPFFVTRGSLLRSPKFAGFDFDEKADDTLLDVFRSGPTAGKTIIDAIAINILKGVELPESARRLAVGILFGTEKLPTARVGQPDNRHRDTLFISLANRLADAATKVSDAPKMHPGAATTSVVKGVPVPICGCSLAAAVLAGCGVTIPHGRAFKILGEKSKLLHGVNGIDRFLQSGPVGKKSNYDGNLTDADFDFRDKVFKAIDYLRRPV